MLFYIFLAVVCPTVFSWGSTAAASTAWTTDTTSTELTTDSSTLDVTTTDSSTLDVTTMGSSTGDATITVDFNRPDEIILHCNPSSLQVDIPKQMLGGALDPVDFYLGKDPNNVTCQGYFNGGYLTLKSSLTGCGTEYSENQTLGFYQNTVMTSGSDIVVYLAVEIPIVCEYDRSKRLMSHFKTISDVIKKQNRGSFSYDFAIYDDITYSQRHYSYPVTVTIGSKLFFRVELLDAPENLNIHLRSCRGTATSTFNDSLVYEFIRSGCGVNNSAVRVLTPERIFQADFELASFRFRENFENSEVWIHCEVVVCDVGDVHSECSHGCEVNRHRRSVEGPDQKVTTLVQGPFILVPKSNEMFETLKQDSLRNGGSAGYNLFVVGLSFISSILLLGVGILTLTLVVVMRRAKRYQPLPNPVDALST